NCFVVVDKVVYELYKYEIEKYFSSKVESFKVHLVDGEDDNKNINQFVKIFEALNNYPINRRNEPVIIIGGGVATDIGAFTTSCFRRGIPHIKVPTTLMGYVDASVGIKTGINFGENKNRMGSFYPPMAVLLDKAFFKTLPERDISNGIGEIIKIAVIKNAKLFSALESNPSALLTTKFKSKESNYILEASIRDMIEELAPNLFEDNLERIVDFGHTFSLVFEMEPTTDIKHGEAVAMDILFSCLLSNHRKLMSDEDLNRVINLINACKLPIYYDLYDANLLWKSLQERVCHRNGLQRVPIPVGIGESVFLNDITYDELKSLCQLIKDKSCLVAA
ncbi:sedoheptulose 7-phosphate cyclase, partial [Zooshikella harenae]